MITRDDKGCRFPVSSHGETDAMDSLLLALARWWLVVGLVAFDDVVPITVGMLQITSSFI